jgi:hypothetical protein
VNLTSHLDLVSKSRKAELYFHSRIRLYGVVINELSTGTIFIWNDCALNSFSRNLLPKITEETEVFCCCNNDETTVSFLLLCRKQDVKRQLAITDAFVVYFQLLDTNML